MMQRTEIAVAAAAFATALVVFAPAEIAVAIGARAAPGFTYAAADGSIWNGRVAGAAVDGVPLGEVRWRAKPGALLLGRLSARISIKGGALDGEGAASLSADEFAVREGVFLFRLDAIRKYSLFGAPYTGVARIKVDRLALGRDGCVDARGDIATTALDAPLKRLGLAALPLDGALSCDGGALVATLDGESPDGRLQIIARATQARTYSLDARALPARRDLGEALAIAGFERDGAALTFRASGQMKGIGS